MPNSLDPSFWKPGDIVSRATHDEQEILWIDHDDQMLSVKCVKEPPLYDDDIEPWCQLGDIENNCIRRYSWVRLSRVIDETQTTTKRKTSQSLGQTLGPQVLSDHDRAVSK